MPQATPNRGYRYPLGGETVAVSADMQRLATDIDADVQLLQPVVRSLQRAGTGATIPNGTTTTTDFTPIVGFGTTLVQVGTYPTYALGVYTIRVAGTYEAGLLVTWPVIAAAHRTILRMLRNGAATPDGLDTRWYPSGTNGFTYQRTSTIVTCAVNDTISQTVYQDSGAAQTTADDGCVFWIKKIG